MMNQKSVNNILIVDDHPIVREGLMQLINKTDHLQVCGEADDFKSAITSVEKQIPDLAIVDISLNDRDGLDLVKFLKLNYPQVQTLILSIHDESLFAERALKAGAKGYIMKHEGTAHVISAIKKVLNGGIYLSETMSERLIKSISSGCLNKQLNPLQQLTDRQLGIYRLVGNGLKNKQIAHRLNVSVKTIEVHRENIKRKLNIKTSNELTISASLWVLKQKGAYQAT